MNKKLTSATHIAVFVVYTMLTASIVSAQTSEGDGDDFTPPAVPEPTPLCPWDDINENPELQMDLFGRGEWDVATQDYLPRPGGPWAGIHDDVHMARACLREAGVNTGLGEYAFPEPLSADAGAIEGASAYTGGQVVRWAMVAALMQAAEQIHENWTKTDFPDGLAGCGPFSDVDFLNAEQLKRVCQANTLPAEPIVRGFPDGEFRPYEPVTRWQMALFFVRFLRYAAGLDSQALDHDLPVETMWAEETGSDGPFADVDWQPDQFCVWGPDTSKAVNLLHRLRVTKGASEGAASQPLCGTGTKPNLVPHPHWRTPGLLYEPGEYVTGDQMALFVVRLLSLTYLYVDDWSKRPKPFGGVRDDGGHRWRGHPYWGDWLPDEIQDLNADIGAVHDVREWFWWEVPEPTPVPGEEGRVTSAKVPVPWEHPLLRPPREINIQAWMTDIDVALSERRRPMLAEIVLGVAESMQPGDWFWTQGGNLMVLYDFYTFGYDEGTPRGHLYFCSVQGPHRGNSVRRATWQAGKNMFRAVGHASSLSSPGLWAVRQQPKAGCEIGDDVPRAADYTRTPGWEYPWEPVVPKPGGGV